jgi:hypothetical protein
VIFDVDHEEIAMRISRLAASCGVVVAILFATAGPAFAQGGAGVGLEIGMTRANVKSEGIEDFFKSRTGVMAGIWFGGNRDGVLGLMGEISYVVKNSTNDAADDIKFRYLEIPILLRANIGQLGTKNGMIVYPLFGPVADIQLKGHLNDLDIRDNFNDVDFGLIGGGGIEFARIGFEARMNWGLRSLEKSGEHTFPGLTVTKSRTFQVLAKLRLN